MTGDAVHDLGGDARMRLAEGVDIRLMALGAQAVLRRRQQANLLRQVRFVALQTVLGDRRMRPFVGHLVLQGRMTGETEVDAGGEQQPRQRRSVGAVALAAFAVGNRSVLARRRGQGFVQITVTGRTHCFLCVGEHAAVGAGMGIVADETIPVLEGGVLQFSVRIVHQGLVACHAEIGTLGPQKACIRAAVAVVADGAAP